MEGGLELPGGGTMVSMLQTCARRHPTVVGKPNQEFLDLIVQTRGIDRSRTVMVGDKLSTDILFGNNGQLKTLLVYTGVTSEADLGKVAQPEMQPQFTASDLPLLMRILKT